MTTATAASTGDITMLHNLKNERYLIQHGALTMLSPSCAQDDLDALTIDELRSTPREANGQFTRRVQNELSIRGSRTNFVRFLRYIYALDAETLDALHVGYKKAFAEVSADDYRYCDMSLMIDAIHYQLQIRDDANFSVGITRDIMKSWCANCQLANDFDDITSEHLIALANQLIARHAIH